MAMSSLFHILNMGGDSLQNARVGVDVTGHNIANAQTPGYSRQRLHITSREPTNFAKHIMGNGAEVQNISRVIDRYVEVQLREETQNNGEKEWLSDGLSRLEKLFNPELTSTVRDRMDTFSNALREFSNFPEEPAVRTSMVEAGISLSHSFNVAHSGVAALQEDLSAELTGSLNELNQKLSEIADLNQRIQEMSAGGRGGEANDLEDKRDVLIREVSSVVNIRAYKSDNGQFVIRGPADSLLVEGRNAARFSLSDERGLGKHPAVMLEDFGGVHKRDVTYAVESGKVGGILATRDKYAQSVRDQLNTMARDFARSFNEIHQKGFGIGEFAEKAGRDFFGGIDGPGEAAQDIEVLALYHTDNTALGAAMTIGASGDNVIANALVRMFQEPLLDQGKLSVNAFYDRIVGRLGLDTMRAKEDHNASNIVLTQLKSQRESVSGVSLDEEATNLLKYQHLFTASSRVITTADEMLKTVLDLKR
jgi:flagellar hook-associated protein 1 FlgK